MFSSDTKTRRSPSSGVLLSTCAYLFVAVSVIGGAFFVTMALTPIEGASAARAQAPGAKIGPGYARMQPVDLGKPEKVAYSAPYYPHVTSRAARITQPAPSMVTAPVMTAAPRIMIVEAVQSSYSRPDVHRVH